MLRRLQVKRLCHLTDKAHGALSKQGRFYLPCFCNRRLSEAADYRVVQNKKGADILEKLLTRLCSTYTVSGNELENLELIKDLFDESADITVDAIGNIIVGIGKRDSKDVIMLDAHNDTIGFAVTLIDENGFLKLANCGGTDRRVLLGSRVTVLGKKHLRGIVCCLPPHLSNGGEDKAPDSNGIYVDTGLEKSELEKYVSVGDKVSLYSKSERLIGNRFKAAGLDNKAGVAVLVRVGQLLSDKNNIESCVKIVFSSQEETGLVGSRTAGFSVKPDCALIVDVSFAKQPGVSEDKSGKLSKGAMIGLSPVLDREMCKNLEEICIKNSIPYQKEIMSGSTGTNADVISITEEGIRTALVSIPLRNMHTQAETVGIDDLENTARLIAEFIESRGVISNG